MAELRIIKKYPNRRLYDTEDSRYITLADVREMIREGLAFKVVDSQSGDDLTRSILLQIIIDQESGGEPLFTSEMLAKFIRFYGGAAQNLFSTYLDQSLQLFFDQQHKMQEQMSDVLRGRPVGTMMEMTQRNLKLWKDIQESFLKAAGFPGSQVEGSSAKEENK